MYVCYSFPYPGLIIYEISTEHSFLNKNLSDYIYRLSFQAYISLLESTKDCLTCLRTAVMILTSSSAKLQLSLLTRRPAVQQTLNSKCQRNLQERNSCRRTSLQKGKSLNRSRKSYPAMFASNQAESRSSL